MNKSFILYLLFFIVTLLLQGLIFNSLALWDFIPLYPYIIFLLALPFGMPSVWQLGVAFLLGLLVDFSAYSLGLHAASCTLMIFVRIQLLKGMSLRLRGLPKEFVNPFSYSVAWAFQYMFLLVIVHHLPIFLLSLWPWQSVWHVSLQYILAIVTNAGIALLVFYLLLPHHAEHN